MASTAPITTSATATTATGPVTALTTTFTPPAKCTEQSLMFTMLSAPNYEVWANEPMPVSSSTVTDCYPSEWIGAYQTANTSSIVPAMSPLVCPLSWETVMTAPGNYIACCPPGFKRTDPKTTVDGYRPFYGGTCYSELPSGSAVRVTQYNNLSISATVTFTASSQNVGLYAHPIDGYAYQAQETIFVSENATSSSSTSSSSSLATPTPTPTPNSSKTLSNGAIAGIVIGSLAGVATALLLLLFLRRRRASSTTTPPPHPPPLETVEIDGNEIQKELDGTQVFEIQGFAKHPIAEVEGRTSASSLPPRAELENGKVAGAVELEAGR